MINRHNVIVGWSKMRRAFASISTTDLLTSMFVLVSIVTIGAILAAGNVTEGTTIFLNWVIRGGIVFSIVLIIVLIVKTRMEYRRRIYDPTLMFVFQEDFDGIEENRKEAANVCLDYLIKTSGKEDFSKWGDISEEDRTKLFVILDWLEDLGFFLQGDQISEEVLHHAFYHWIRGWYSVLASFIKYYQETEGEGAAYVYTEPLYGRTSVPEKKYDRARLWLKTTEEKLQFLQEEGANVKPLSPNS